jgi:hypothetical protein
VSGQQGWNRCDCCGRFVSPERDGWQITEWRSLSLYGDLVERYEATCGPCQPTQHEHKGKRLQEIAKESA